MATKADKSTGEGQQLKKFMQSENVWDLELFKILLEMEIKTEEDIGSIGSESQFDEIVRKTRVAHASETKESDSLARLNKLLSNFEKIWRKKSGIKATTIKDTDNQGSSRKDKEEGGSRAKHDAALKKGNALKKYMQAENVWDVDFFVELVEIGVVDESGIAGITQTQFDEVCRKTKVIRAADNNSVSHNANLEKLLTKFEKLWRKASGIKRTNMSPTQESEDKSDREDERSSSRRDDALKKGQELKKFMQKEGVWDVDLFVELVSIGITESSAIESITQTQFDEVCRKTKVIRLSDNNDVSFNANLEKLLTKFEKIWRQASGIKRTNITNSDHKSSDREEEGSNARRDDAMKKGQALKKYMQKENIWDVDLFIELVEAGVTDESAIANISQTEFDEICRKTKVIRVSQNNSVSHNANLEKLLTKFEKLWRTASGIKITTIKPGSKAESGSRPQGDTTPTDGTGAFKKWMQKENVFEKELFDELVRQGITKEEDLESVTQTQFDEIVRKVRVEKFAELKDEIARARLDKKLIDFEKIWRKISGVKRTAQTR